MTSKKNLFRTGFIVLLGLIATSIVSASPAAAGYHYEGIGFYTEASPTDANTPIYRFYNSRNGEHFFTVSPEEKSAIEANPSWSYHYEGIAFYGMTSSNATNTPMYRFYNTRNGFHFYTVGLDEKTALENNPASGYHYEGIGFYTDRTLTNISLPAYRFYNSDTSDHFFTISELEKSALQNGNIGPDISVGLWNVSKADSVATPFKIQASKDYAIVDGNGNRLATIPAATITRISYGDGGNLKLFDSVPDTLVNQKVTFQAADGNNADMIFNVFQPGSSYDHFRGRVSVRYSDTSKSLWMINTLPLEHYVWGIGEITGTGDADYNRTMTTTFRTYGIWKIYHSTAYATEGFTVVPTSSNQLYYGYDWETSHPNIKTATQDTLGRIAKYGNDIALSPYSSWTDGRTRSFQEVWGSTLYPWCQSVADPYGKNSSMTTTQLQAAGNHMVGISAHGALSLATDSGWDWTRILTYYLTDISLPNAY